MSALNRLSGRALARAVGLFVLAVLACPGLGVAAAVLPDAQPSAAPAAVAPASAPAAASGSAGTGAATAPLDSGGGRKASPPLKVEGIAGVSGASGGTRPVGLNEELYVKLVLPAPAASSPTLHASRYALFFNGREVKGLPDPVYLPAQQSLVYVLKRNDTNKDLWTSLLGSPSLGEFTRAVTVSLGERPPDPKQATLATIVGATDGVDTLELKELPPIRFAIAIVLIVSVIWLVFARTARSTTLRDNLLPQIMPKLQTYSLGRCQMAFWFVLILCSFVFLYVITWDFNTISQQALELMGISGATALGAVAVDHVKDSPADAVNRGLRALGLNSYDDVLRVQQERDGRARALAAAQEQLAALPASIARASPQATEKASLNQQILKLQTDIQDRDTILRTYTDRTRPYLTEGWFRDITTDLNGTTIHRLQVFWWTLILGGIFLIGVYRNLAMPEFSSTLLALLGVSGAGYVGFKYPEKNS